MNNLVISYSTAMMQAKAAADAANEVLISAVDAGSLPPNHLAQAATMAQLATAWATIALAVKP